ncbi:hypothetical protein B5X24_HaOG205605 [Helicoverpa armigera]|uniref:Amino acid transporter transmembrane domain-containing protein n=1 Tax=Helicoverpa armigera TaxID=29058 RepID=A0A2W1BNH3_HELAM|nr:hypothetical protein B5X24_HaOG205605 [Helicoverpa armigera]
MNQEMMLPSYFGGYGPPARFRAKNNPVDAKNYDFRANRTFASAPNTVIESVFHMLMFGLGGGLVVLHGAYMECGIWTALVVNIALAALIGYCSCTLVWSAQKLYGRVVMPTLTYPDIMEATVLLCPWKLFRKTARCLRYLVEFTIMLNLYGSCCVLVIMIARNLKELVSGDNTINDSDDPPLKVYILILMIPCIIICMVTDLKILAPFALICDMFAVVLIVITLWYAFHNSKVSPLDRAPYRSVMGLFEFMSVCTFVLEPVSYALPVENNMNEPKKFHNVVMIAMSINTVAMITVGFVGFWHYGNFAVSPITIHLPFSPFALTLKVGLCIILYVIYSMCFYVAFDIEWFYLKRHHQMSNYWFWERLYRTIHVIILIMVSYCLPNVTRLMGIIGALCTSPAVFIYPYFIELLLDWEHPGLGRCKWRLLRFIVMLTFGLVLFVAGTYYNGLGMYLELENRPKANISFDPENQMPELERKEINFEIGTELSVDPKKRLNLTDEGKHNYDLNVALPYEVPYNLFDQNLNANYSTKKANIVFEYYNNTLIHNNNIATNLRRYENLAPKANGTLNTTPENKNLIINIILPDINNYTVLFNSTTPIMPEFNNVTALDNVTNTLSLQ